MTALGYHADSSASSAGESAAPNPYAYEVVPPIGRLLIEICKHLSVGGCFRPGNRQLAGWLGYAGASQIPYLLSQLACDGWIDYDRDSRLIMLLRDYRSDRSIRSIDQADTTARSVAAIDSEVIDPIDRFSPLQDAADLPIRSIDRPDSQCMESLVTTTSESGSAVVVTGGDARGGRQSAAEVMAEMGANWKIVKEAFAARPDWTAQQVRARWEYDQRRILASDGKLNEGVFFTALRCGELAPVRPDPAQPLDPQAYADDPAFKLGSDTSPPNADRRREQAYADAHWRAVDLLGPGAPFRDMAIVVERLVKGDSDEQALKALDALPTAVRR